MLGDSSEVEFPYICVVGLSGHFWYVKGPIQTSSL